MKLHLDQPAHLNAITGYGAGYIQINQNRHAGSLIVLPTRLIDNWRPRTFADLAAEDFAELASLQVEIVLLGTGVLVTRTYMRRYGAVSGHMEVEVATLSR